MDPIVGGALIGGAANVIGGLFSQSSARSAYQSRYQDTVADMRKAGLNPALAYGQNPGGGAQTANFGDIGSNAASAAQASAQAAKTKAETDLLNAQAAELRQRPRLENALLGKRVELADSMTDRNTLLSNLLGYDINTRKHTNAQEIAALLAEYQQTQYGTPEARARAKYYTQLGPGAFYLNNAIDVGKAAAQIYGARALGRKPQGPPDYTEQTNRVNGTTYKSRNYRRP